MQSGVAFVVSLEHFSDKDTSANQEFYRLESVVATSHVKNRLVLVVTQQEVLFAFCELLFEHWQIVELQAVKQR